MEKFDLKQITENKPLFYTIIICGAAVAIMFVMMVIALTVNSGGAVSQDGKIKAAEQVIKNDPVTLFTTDNTGKALEVQALLARIKKRSPKSRLHSAPAPYFHTNLKNK